MWFWAGVCQNNLSKSAAGEQTSRTICFIRFSAWILPFPRLRPTFPANTGAPHPLEGCACTISAYEQVLRQNLRTEPHQMVIADQEAGVESFGRGIEAGCDTVHLSGGNRNLVLKQTPGINGMFLA